MALQTFTAGQVLTAAQMTSLQANDYNQTVSTKTASYTLVAADKGTRVVMNSASATTITVNTSLFSAGDTLILQNIGAGVCTVTAGTATVSSAGSLAIPQNGSGTLYFTSAGVSIYYPSAAVSKIAQVVSTAKTDTFSTTSTSFVDITGLSVSITPSSATSKILVLATFKTAVSGDISFFHRLIRGSTAICIGDTAGSRTPTTTTNIPGSTGNIDVVTQAINFLDSPATTSATTYKIDCRVSSGTGYLNRTGFDTDSASVPRTASTITVMEILA